MASRTSSASTTSSRSSTCWPEFRLLAAPRSRAAVWVSPAAAARSAEAVNSVLPSVQTSSTSIPAGILISALCTQVSHGSLQPSTRKVHAPLAVQGDRGRPPVEAGRGGPVHAEHRLLPLRVRQHDRRVDRVVALPEDLGPDRDGLTDRGLGRIGAALDDRRHLHHRNPVDQGAELRWADGDRRRRRGLGPAPGLGGRRARGGLGCVVAVRGRGTCTGSRHGAKPIGQHADRVDPRKPRPVRRQASNGPVATARLSRCVQSDVSPSAPSCPRS